MTKLAVENITEDDYAWDEYSVIKDMTTYTVTVSEPGPSGAEYVAYNRNGDTIKDVELRRELIDAVIEFKEGEN